MPKRQNEGSEVKARKDIALTLRMVPKSSDHLNGNVSRRAREEGRKKCAETRMKRDQIVIEGIILENVLEGP